MNKLIKIIAGLWIVITIGSFAMECPNGGLSDNERCLLMQREERDRDYAFRLKAMNTILHRNYKKGQRELPVQPTAEEVLIFQMRYNDSEKTI